MNPRFQFDSSVNAVVNVPALALRMADASAIKLRRVILDERRSIAPTAMLDCAAHMLLYFDQPRIMQYVGLRHLLERSHSERGAVIYGPPVEGAFSTFVAERQIDAAMPKESEVFSAKDQPSFRVRWDSSTAIAGGKPCLSPTGHASPCRQWAHALEHRRKPWGVVVVETREDGRLWTAVERQYLAMFTQDFLAPLLSASSARLEQLTRLTKAELAVLRLASQGMSYKRIAAELGKSPNTVDNQLRRLRAKFGAHNQFELLRACEAVL